MSNLDDLAKMQQAEKELAELESVYTELQADAALTAASMAPPPVGTVADVVSIGKSLWKGDWGGALLDIVGTIPIVGDGIKGMAKGTKIANKMKDVGTALKAARVKLAAKKQALKKTLTNPKSNIQKSMADCGTQKCKNKGDGGIIGGKNAKPKSGPGSDAHRAEKWEEYKNNPDNAGWTKERWDKQYDVNMQQAKKSHEAVASYRKNHGFSEENGWKTEQTLASSNGNKRRLDIVNKDTLEAIEHKRGKQYLTKDIRSEIERDASLRKDGWDVKWHFDGHASKPLTDELDRLGIPWTKGN